MNHPFSPDWSRIPKCGKYIAIKCPSHPACWKNGYIYLHRIIMEIKLGRILTGAEVIHHKDENGHNNDPENLEIVANQAAHAKIHKPKSPDARVTLKCDHCGKPFIRLRRRTKDKMGRANNFCSYSCNGKFNGYKHAAKAQLDEQIRPKDEAVGSTPTGGATSKAA